MALQGLHPAPDMPGVSPARPVGLMDGVSCFSEGWHGRRMPLSQGITALGNSGSNTRRLLPSLGQTNGRERAQADVSPASVDGDAQHPGLASRPADVEVEATAVGVPTWLPEGLGPRRR